MPIIASAPQSDFEPAPEGLHQAVCIDVIDLGMVTETYDGKERTSHKIRVVWEIDAEDERGRRFRVFQRYTNSLHEKAKLRGHLEAWRGRKFTPEELKGFDVEKLVGANCQLTLIRNGDYTNVNGIAQLAKGMSKLKPSDDYVRVKDRPGAQPPTEDNDEQEVPF